MTPGRIACGQEDCFVGREVCCLETIDGRAVRGFCLAPAELTPLEPERGGSTLLWCPDARAKDLREAPEYVACDDIGDCPSGQKCCNQAYGLGEGIFVDRYECAEKCLLGEQCVGPGGCSDGSDCVIPEWSPHRGHCQYRTSVQCGDVRCQGDQPWCCDTDGEFTCVSDDECPLSRYQCLRQPDCGPDDPCTRSEGGTACGLIEFQPLACETDADCPKQGLNSGPCIEQKTGPPGLRFCGFEGEY